MSNSVRQLLDRTACGVLCALSLVWAPACASSPDHATMDVAPTPTASADSVRTEDLNRRLRAAADRDAATRSTATESASEYRIGALDRLAVEVFDAEAFSGEYRVEESGEISVPLLGAVPAAGKTPRELEEHLEAELAASYMRDPHVTVQVTEMLSHGISVVGAVRVPGVYQVSGTATLLEVLAMAEGLTEEAGGRVYVVRGAAAASAGPPSKEELDPLHPAAAEQELIEVDLGALLESGRTEENVLLRAGDIVQVRPSGLVYVVGEVNRPGGFATPAGRPMTVLQAVAMAEGLGSTAAADRAVIVRDGPDGDRVEIPVDLGAVLEGSEPAPEMAARDVLFVPNNSMKAFGLGVVNALVSMVTFRGLVY